MLEIVNPSGRLIATGETVRQPYDSIVLDGKHIGFSYRFENVIHWMVPKSSLPQKIIKQAVWLLQSRNLKHEQQRLRVTG